MNSDVRTVLVTGGAGYVGSVLVPKLLKKGYRVRVLDLYLYEPEVFALHRGPMLEEIKGDLRDGRTRARALRGADAVIHLACISNDPSFELDPVLGKSINYDAMVELVRDARAAGIKRFIFASTSSVYGVKETENVTEDLPLEPLTDYSKYKAMGEELLMREGAPHFTATVIRSATVCGYSPRMRFDLTVNILTNHAWNNGKIVVFGGDQKRPNVHIEDITDLYAKILEFPRELIHGKIYNFGSKNHSVSEIAALVRDVVGGEQEKEIAIEYKDGGDDKRSYHISSEKIRRELNIVPQYAVRDAVADLCAAFREGKFHDSLSRVNYFNVKLMQYINLR